MHTAIRTSYTALWNWVCENQSDIPSPPFFEFNAACKPPLNLTRHEGEGINYRGRAGWDVRWDSNGTVARPLESGRYINLTYTPGYLLVAEVILAHEIAHILQPIRDRCGLPGNRNQCKRGTLHGFTFASTFAWLLASPVLRPGHYWAAVSWDGYKSVNRYLREHACIWLPESVSLHYTAGVGRWTTTFGSQRREISLPVGDDHQEDRERIIGVGLHFGWLNHRERVHLLRQADNAARDARERAKKKTVYDTCTGEDKRLYFTA